MHKQKTGFSRSKPNEILRLNREFRVPSSSNDELIEEFFVAIGTPVALSCYILFRNREFDQLVNKDVDPSVYLDGSQLRCDLAAVSFLRKNSSIKTSFQKKSRALDAFAEAEHLCYLTNIRLNPYASVALKELSTHARSVINLTRQKIRAILGDFDVDLFLDSCTWGPGSTLLLRGDQVSASHKFDVECQVTKDAHYLFQTLLEKAYPNWSMFSNVEFVTGNKVVTVPKNAKIDRTIAIEPGLNIWIQLGIGKVIRKRLRKAGYDLNTDAVNKRLCREGSRTGLIATLDFKAASDTISTRVVEDLLPSKWYEILNDARSHYYRDPCGSDTFRYHKFSTMGNGFTFELESLIFIAVGLATCEILGCDSNSTAIFGDDLVLPVGAVSLSMEVFSYLGFTVNSQKSFSSGNFRESCGSYYFNGMDVKPFFLKKSLRFAKDLFRFANAINLLASTWGEPLGRDSRFYRLWQSTVDALPKELRLFGPASSGDSTIHVSHFSDSREAALCKDGWEGFTFPALPTVALSASRDSYGLLLSKLHRPSMESQGNEVPRRAKVKIGRAHV